jgi:hypothetical protein
VQNEPNLEGAAGAGRLPCKTKPIRRGRPAMGAGRQVCPAGVTRPKRAKRSQFGPDGQERARPVGVERAKQSQFLGMVQFRPPCGYSPRVGWVAPIKGSQTRCIQWHRHPADDSWAGSPCHLSPCHPYRLLPSFEPGQFLGSGTEGKYFEGKELWSIFHPRGPGETKPIHPNRRGWGTGRPPCGLPARTREPIVQNEPNLARLQRRRPPGGRIVQNKPNFGRPAGTPGAKCAKQSQFQWPHRPRPVRGLALG